MSWSIFIEAHRAQVSRRRNLEERDRVLVFARDPVVLRWIEHELFGEPVSSSIVDSLTDVVATLTLSPPPWPRYLIIDAAELSEPDIRLLGAIREAGWPGAVIAIGDASTDAHRSLGIDAVVPRTLGCEVLRNELKRARAVALRAFEQKRA
jgi:hypothetical protein